MKNITYRTNFLEKNVINGITEYDLSSLNFGDYEWGDLDYYRVRLQDVQRPDLISFNIYGTTNYWWFIMWFNGISDIWNDLVEDMILKYPSIDKIREAFKIYNKE